MIQIKCVTSYPFREEIWPTELECRPMIGDYIESGKVWKGKHGTYGSLCLRVKTVKYKFYTTYESPKNWELQVELEPDMRLGEFVGYYYDLTGKAIYK